MSLLLILLFLSLTNVCTASDFPQNLLTCGVTIDACMHAKTGKTVDEMFAFYRDDTVTIVK